MHSWAAPGEGVLGSKRMNHHVPFPTSVCCTPGVRGFTFESSRLEMGDPTCWKRSFDGQELKAARGREQ